MLVRLPVSPSVNSMYRNVVGVGRVKTTDYRNWLKHAGTLLNISRPVPFGKMRVQLGVMIPEKTKGDLDNRIKAVQDLLVAHRVIDDDKQIWRIVAERHPEPDMLVSLMPYGEPSLESRIQATGQIA